MTYSLKFTNGESAVFPDVIELLYLSDHIYRLTMTDKQKLVVINVVTVSQRKEKKEF